MNRGLRHHWTGYHEPDIAQSKGRIPVAHDPTRRSLRMLAVIGALLALPLLAACNNSEEDDDDDDDDGMRRPAAVLVLPR